MQNKTNLVYDHQIFSISEYGGAARYFLKLIEYMNHQEKWNTELFSGLFMNQFLKKSHIKNKGMYFPVVNWVFPYLAFSRKIVWWDTSYF